MEFTHPTQAMDNSVLVTPACLDATVDGSPFLTARQASCNNLHRLRQDNRNSLSFHPSHQFPLASNPTTYGSMQQCQRYYGSKLTSRMLVFFCIHLLFCVFASLASAASPAETITLSKPLNHKGEEHSEKTELKIHRSPPQTSSEDAISGIELSGDLSDSSASGDLEADLPELDELDIEMSLDEIELQSGTLVLSSFPRKFNNNGEFLHAMAVSGTAQFYASRMHIDFQRMLYSTSEKSLYAVAKEATLVKLDGKTLSLIDSHTVASQPQASIYCQQSAGCRQRKEINVLAKTPDKSFIYYCTLHYEDHPRLLSRRALTSCVVPNPHDLAENLLMWDNVYYTSTDPHRPPVILAPKKKTSLKSADRAANQSFIYVAGVNSNFLHIGRLPMPDWASGDINWEGALFSPKRSVFIQEPATIVISFETETAVYFLLREKPSRYSVPSSCFQQQRQVVSRLVRVCQGDRGGLRGIAEHYFGTMAKADLVCQSEVVSPLGGGRRSHFSFDHAQSAYWDEDAKRLYVTFTAGEAAPRGSAVCVYDLQSIERVFKGPIATFDSYQQRTLKNQGSLRSNPFPNICERFINKNLTDEELSLGQIGANFMYRAEYIRPLFGHAVAMSSTSTWTAVIGYQLLLLTNSLYVTSILWLVSDDQLTQIAFYETRGSGAAFKPPALISTCVLRSLRVGPEHDLLGRFRVGGQFPENHAFTAQHPGSPPKYLPFDIDDPWKIELPSPSELPNTERINSILREGDSIFLGTTHAIFRFPTDNCASYTTKEACLESKDPHCGWSSQINQCLSIRGYSQASNLLVASINTRPQCPSSNQSRSTFATSQSGWSKWQQCNLTNTFQSDGFSRNLKEIASDQQYSCLCRICLGETLCNFGEQQVSHCKVPGIWSQWSEWSPCKDKQRYRTRVCLKPLLAATTTVISPFSDCPGPSREEEFCLMHPLVPEGKWLSFNLSTLVNVYFHIVEVDFKGLPIEHAALREETGRGFNIDRNYLLGVLMGSFAGIFATLVFMFLFLRFCHRPSRYRTAKRLRPLWVGPHSATRRVSNIQLERQIRDSLLSDHPMYANPSPMTTSVQSTNFPRYNYTLQTPPPVSVERFPDSSPSVDETFTTAGVYDRLSEDKSMKGRLHCQCYSFDETFKTYDFQKFATAFFNSDVVRGTLETDEGLPLAEECEVEAIHVPCSLLSMDIFNRCVGVVTHPTGRIKSCFEEYHNSMLCINDSEDYDLFSEGERAEFLFRLFKHVVIGGELVQPSDDISVYTDFVRNLYRDLISVQKVAGSDEINIVSLVYDVKVKNNHLLVYPAAKEHENTFAYLIVNPIKRHVFALSHVYGIGQF
ncbi:unnamed protein product [Mesocestoides corti]|uniref:Cilia- and flagella-associated protein 300 n=2 Tax=Mesocestoides corti TaxID=53468 RepID=A0A3P6HSD0_MESCO|nr:unnamed protein product [Mesocestoides corti]